MGWQRSQVGALHLQTRGNGLGASSHDALLVGETIGAQGSVNRFQISPLGKRHKVVSACRADQIFHTALLPTGMDIGKERFKAIDAVKVQKHVMFAPTVSL